MQFRLLLAGVLIASCAAPSGATPTTADTPAVSTVEATGFLFRPAELTVSPGSNVSFVNNDHIHHTVTSGTVGDQDDLFDLNLPEKGAAGEVTFDTPGRFEYFCAIHSHMRGVVEVKAP